MKKESASLYRDRIVRVYDYIKSNLSGDLSVDRLADVACLSPYHFHRVYRRFVGETLSGAVRRCRLYQSGKLLVETPISIVEIAYRSGYYRTDSFSRAFQRFYGVSPERFRQQYDDERILVATATENANSGFEQKWLLKQSGPLVQPEVALWHSIYQVALVELPCVELICLESDSTKETLEPKFVDLNLKAQDYGLSLSARNFLGIFYKDALATDTVSFSHRYAYAALPIDASQREGLEIYTHLPFKLQTLSAGLYATYIYSGPYAMSERSHEWLYGYWLPSNGMRVSAGPVIEEYLNDPRQTRPQYLQTRVFVKVEHG